MRALLRKDALWMSGLGLAGLVIGLVAMVDLAGAGLWFRPDIPFGEGALVFHWVASGLLGLFAALFEDANRTREYVLHRPISPARLFWARHLMGGLVVLGWIVLLPLLHLAGTVLFHPSGSLAEPGRVWGFFNHGTVGAVFYAVAVFGVTAARRLVLGIGVAFVLSLVLLLFFALGLQTEHEGMRAFMVAGSTPIALAIAAPLMWTSMRLEREGRDLDRPLSRARLGAVACGFLSLALAGSVFLHMVQLDARRNLSARYPRLGRLADGTPVLVAYDNYRPHHLVDAQHRRIQGKLPELETVFEPRSGSLGPRREKLLADRGRRVRGVRYERVQCLGHFCYVGSDGLVHLYGWDRDGSPGEVRRLGKPDGARFSPRSHAMGFWNRTALMADRADGTLWRYDLGGQAATFSPVVLPAGDTFVEDLTEPVGRELAPEVFTPELLVVRGQRGIYLAERSGFVPAPPDIARAVERVDRKRQRPPMQAEFTGPVHARVTLPASGQEPAFAHDYAPRTFLERLTAGWMMSLSLLRPPVLGLGSLFFRDDRPSFGNPTDDDARIFLDPMVMLHAGWILVPCLLLAAGLAFLTFRRLGRLGVPGPRRAFWTAAVVVFGPAAYVVQRACETDRAWRPLPQEESRPPLLIKTAA